MGFFKGFNFPRFVILVSLLSSCVLGYFVYTWSARLDEIHRELEQTPELVKEIQQLGITLDQYQELDSSGTEGADFDFEPYIRRIAVHERVGIGSVTITPSPRRPSKDIVDAIYKIKPSAPNPRFHRSKIGNFLYKLESESRRVRVTSFKLTPVSKVKPGETGEDVWTYDATITSRTKVSSES